MEVDDPCELKSFLISVERWRLEGREQRGVTCTHVVAKKVAVPSKMFASLLEVSLNPGTSMRVTERPSRSNSSESWISAAEFDPIRRFEPLARLMNWKHSG